MTVRREQRAVVPIGEVIKWIDIGCLRAIVTTHVGECTIFAARTSQLNSLRNMLSTNGGMFGIRLKANVSHQARCSRTTLAMIRQKASHDTVVLVAIDLLHHDRIDHASQLR